MDRFQNYSSFSNLLNGYYLGWRNFEETSRRFLKTWNIIMYWNDITSIIERIWYHGCFFVNYMSFIYDSMYSLFQTHMTLFTYSWEWYMQVNMQVNLLNCSFNIIFVFYIWFSLRIIHIQQNLLFYYYFLSQLAVQTDCSQTLLFDNVVVTKSATYKYSRIGDILIHFTDFMIGFYANALIPGGMHNMIIHSMISVPTMIHSLTMVHLPIMITIIAK